MPEEEPDISRITAISRESLLKAAREGLAPEALWEMIGVYLDALDAEGDARFETAERDVWRHYSLAQTLIDAGLQDDAGDALTDLRTVLNGTHDEFLVQTTREEWEAKYQELRTV